MMESAGDSATLPMGTQQQIPQQRHQHQVLSRPNSLLGPEKEPINFHINLVGAPDTVEQLIEHIKQVASQFLYHWKTFPISKSFNHYLFIDFVENSTFIFFAIYLKFLTMQFFFSKFQTRRRFV